MLDTERAVCWVNWRSKRTVNGESLTWSPRGPWCSDVAPIPDAECSREPGHPGRHMASIGMPGGAVIAAWPLTHAPIVADLIRCPGCGANADLHGDCCEYTNLASGRTHYCGDDGCYCRGLRKLVHSDVLEWARQGRRWEK